MIAKGGTSASKFYLGSSEVSKIYKGDTLVYGGSSPVLPYDAEVEYLASSSSRTEYINTGIVPTAATGIYIKATATVTTDSYTVGLRDTTGETRWCIGHSTYGAYYGYGKMYGQYYNSNDFIGMLNYLNDGKWVAKSFEGVTKVNCTLPSLGFTPENQIRLFGSSGVSSWYTKFGGRLYFVKISQGTEVIMDLIPVRKDGVGYMYDKISGTLFGNNGTGAFTYGADVV